MRHLAGPHMCGPVTGPHAGRSDDRMRSGPSHQLCSNHAARPTSASMMFTFTSASTPRRIGVSEGHADYKWWALSCTSLGMLLAATNSGTLIIALPDLERSLHTSLLALVWVILAYLIAATVLVLMAGRLSDLFGRKRAYVGGFVVFALASLGAGFSPDATVLIGWRILQGIGSAFLFANAAALVTDAFPKEELGLAMGANTMVAAIGLVLGPVLGGALVAISWHWVFWFNVPFALAGAAWGALILRELARREHVQSYDVLGTATFVLGLTGLVFGVSRGGLSGWNDTLVIAALAAAAVLLPAWVAIERRSRAPMLDLGLFNNRLFAAATASAFINGLARFALMFLFVFYFQGAQSNSPIEAGIKLIPLALGMLIASPLAGVYADRHGSRTLAALGMLVSAAGLAGMTTLGVHTAYWQSAVWLALVGVGSGMFNSPNTAAMMGAVPAQRRGIAAGARTLVQNTGAVLSIAFVLAIVTSSVPKSTLFAVFSGLAHGLSEQKLAPFIDNMHVALWVLAATSLVGAFVCLLRPSHVSASEEPALQPMAPVQAPPASARGRTLRTPHLGVGHTRADAGRSSIGRQSPNPSPPNPASPDPVTVTPRRTP
jgi:EmrB/QacA subfamily drug resistance transporter